jgi:hypothetical protein
MKRAHLPRTAELTKAASAALNEIKRRTKLPKRVIIERAVVGFGQQQEEAK